VEPSTTPSSSLSIPVSRLKGVIERCSVKVGTKNADELRIFMVWLWFFIDVARQQIRAALEEVTLRRILPEEELRRLRTHYVEHQIGELSCLVQEGVRIVPRHTGKRPIWAMGGHLSKILTVMARSFKIKPSCRRR